MNECVLLAKSICRDVNANEDWRQHRVVHVKMICLGNPMGLWLKFKEKNVKKFSQKHLMQLIELINLLCKMDFSSSGFSSGIRLLRCRLAKISSKAAFCSSFGRATLSSFSYFPHGPVNPSTSSGWSFLSCLRFSFGRGDSNTVFPFVS